MALSLHQEAQIKPLRGFDRLASAGFSEEDILNIRRQFHSRSVADYLSTAEFPTEEECASASAFFPTPLLTPLTPLPRRPIHLQMKSTRGRSRSSGSTVLAVEVVRQAGQPRVTLARERCSMASSSDSFSHSSLSFSYARQSPQLFGRVGTLSKRQRAPCFRTPFFPLDVLLMMIFTCYAGGACRWALSWVLF